jgi:hypothetical protein
MISSILVSFVQLPSSHTGYEQVGKQTLKSRNKDALRDIKYATTQKKRLQKRVCIEEKVETV